mmetsp:Transcript_29804/g.69177  ORF Transcript_29804/g.69177 Transcript_29804/m.69177 type:complete len:699 (+) Transcript_29804:822-2918(+)
MAEHGQRLLGRAEVRLERLRRRLLRHLRRRRRRRDRRERRGEIGRRGLRQHGAVGVDLAADRGLGALLGPVTTVEHDRRRERQVEHDDHAHVEDLRQHLHGREVHVRQRGRRRHVEHVRRGRGLGGQRRHRRPLVAERDLLQPRVRAGLGVGLGRKQRREHGGSHVGLHQVGRRVRERERPNTHEARRVRAVGQRHRRLAEQVRARAQQPRRLVPVHAHRPLALEAARHQRDLGVVVGAAAQRVRVRLGEQRRDGLLRAVELAVLSVGLRREQHEPPEPPPLVAAHSLGARSRALRPHVGRSPLSQRHLGEDPAQPEPPLDAHQAALRLVGVLVSLPLGLLRVQLGPHLGLILGHGPLRRLRPSLAQHRLRRDDGHRGRGELARLTVAAVLQRRRRAHVEAVEHRAHQRWRDDRERDAVPRIRRARARARLLGLGLGRCGLRRGSVVAGSVRLHHHRRRWWRHQPPRERHLGHVGANGVGTRAQPAERRRLGRPRTRAEPTGPRNGEEELAARKSERAEAGYAILRRQPRRHIARPVGRGWPPRLGQRPAGVVAGSRGLAARGRGSASVSVVVGERRGVTRAEPVQRGGVLRRVGGQVGVEGRKPEEKQVRPRLAQGVVSQRGRHTAHQVRRQVWVDTRNLLHRRRTNGHWVEGERQARVAAERAGERGARQKGREHAHRRRDQARVAERTQAEQPRA